MQHSELHKLVSTPPQESSPAELIDWQNACTKAAGEGHNGSVINNFLCINKGKILTLTLGLTPCRTRTRILSLRYPTPIKGAPTKGASSKPGVCATKGWHADKPNRPKVNTGRIVYYIMGEGKSASLHVRGYNAEVYIRVPSGCGIFGTVKLLYHQHAHGANGPSISNIFEVDTYLPTQPDVP